MNGLSGMLLRGTSSNLLCYNLQIFTKELILTIYINRLLTRLPRMPFPPTSTSSTNTDDFDLSSTLTRTATLQAQLTINTQSCNLLRRQIAHKKAALKRDRKELKTLEDGLRGSREVRKRKERGLHAIARAVEREVEDDSDEGGDSVEEIERVNAICGIGSSTGRMNGASTTTTPQTLSINSENDAGMDSLLAQLQSHLLSMRNNTTTMLPVLEAMTETKVALDKFAARSLDGETLRRVYPVAEICIPASPRTRLNSHE